MLRIVVRVFAVLAVLVGVGSSRVFAQQPAEQPPQPRIAFVAGTGAYQKAPLKTALNDAGLVAETLRSIGFDVSEGADLSQADLIGAIRDFVAKADSAGPDAIAVVYIAGYGAEFEGENYLFGSDAKFARASDIPLEAVRLSDLLRPLGATPSRAKIVILDASRPLPLTSDNKSLSRGLAAVEPPENMLIAYAAGPETLSPPDAAGDVNYGPYATALAEMLPVPGIGLDAMMTRVRARVHQLTEGKQTPWHVAGSLANFVIDQSAPEADASAPAPTAPRLPSAQGRALRDLGAEEAYSVAIERDNLSGYGEFIQAYPTSPYVARVRAMMEVRREALAWSRAVRRGSADAYWSYLQRYPNGRHAFEAQRRLGALSQPIAPPQDFTSDFYADLPPPPPDVVYYDEPAIYEIVAPAPPIILIEPAPIYFLRLPPPPRRRPGFLPSPHRGAGPGAGFLRPRFTRPANLPGRPGGPNVGAGQNRPGQNAAPNANPNAGRNPGQTNAAPGNRLPPHQALPRPGVGNAPPAPDRAGRFNRGRDGTPSRDNRPSRVEQPRVTPPSGVRRPPPDIRPSRGGPPQRAERPGRSPRFDRTPPSRATPRYEARPRTAPPAAPRFSQPQPRTMPQRMAPPPRMAPQRMAPPPQRAAPPPRMAAPPRAAPPRAAAPPRMAPPRAAPRPAPRAAPAPRARCAPGTKC